MNSTQLEIALSHSKEIGKLLDNGIALQNVMELIEKGGENILYLESQKLEIILQNFSIFSDLFSSELKYNPSSLFQSKIPKASIDKLKNIFKLYEEIKLFLKCNVSFSNIFSLDHDLRSLILVEYREEVLSVLKRGVPFSEIASFHPLEFKKRLDLLKNKD